MSEETSNSTNQEQLILPKDSGKSAEKSSEDNGSLSKNLVRPKKLGLSSMSEGENELSGKSKRSKNPLKSKSARSSQDDVLFDPPSDEIAKTSLPKETPSNEDRAKESKEAQKREDSAKEEAVKAEIRKHKLKVNGEEIEVDDEELKRGYQIRKASDQVFQEAAKMRKEAEQWKADLKDKAKLAKILQENGYDPRQLAEEYLSEMLDFQMKTPEQQKIAILEAREAQRQKEIKETIERQAREKAAKEEDEIRDSVKKSIMSTLDANADLPKDSNTIRKFIYQMRLRLNANKNLPEHLREVVTPEVVVEDVKNMLRGELQSGVSQMTPEQLVNFIGEEKIKELRKWELSKLKNPIKEGTTKPSGENVQPEQKKRHYKTMEEWKANQRANGIKVW